VSAQLLNRVLPGGFHVAKATEADRQEIDGLLLETARWLESKGSKQWAALLDGDDIHGTREAVAAGNVFVVRRESELAGMVILFPEPTTWDAELWEKEEARKAVYLHRLAVARKFAGSGLGSQILEWAMTGLQFEDREVMRLDCMAEVGALDKFYRKHGFERLGERNGFLIYQRPFESG
jgi:ribosomal protein S18 acetylase RimI-like enzyme